MKLISCNHIKKGRGRRPEGCPRSGPDEAGARLSFWPSLGLQSAPAEFARHKRKRKGLSRGQLLQLSLMCLVVFGDLKQQETANQCAQSVGEVTNLPPESSGGRDEWLAFGASVGWRHLARAGTTSQGGGGGGQERNRDNKGSKSSSHGKGRPSGVCREARGLRGEEMAAASARASGGLILFAEANSDANRLYEDLMMTYNRIIRPVQNNSDRVVVRLSLKLSQLIDVVSRRPFSLSPCSIVCSPFCRQLFGAQFGQSGPAGWAGLAG